MSIIDEYTTQSSVPTDISDREFQAFRDLIYEVTGINLSPAKKALVCSRLAKRLRELKIPTFAEYYAFLLSEGIGSAECQCMINCITTNKTNFFRESHHFDYLKNHVLPQAEQRVLAGQPRRLRIWSAGCSTGEEPYTISMSLLQHFGAQVSSWDLRILASDIDTEVLAKAKAGEYTSSQLVDIPAELRRQYFESGSDGSRDRFRARPELGRLIAFRQINLIADSWPIHAKFDLIFCRNVLIYFDRDTQIRIVSRMADLLAPHGVLFLGHSENVDWSANLLTSLGHTMFSRKATGQSAPAAATETSLARLQSARTNPAPRPSALRSGPALQPRRASAPQGAGSLGLQRIIIGEVVAAARPVELGTLLGSCVAVCLFDPAAGVGGMNHYMLPRDADQSENSARYGDKAIEKLVTEVVLAGGQRDRLHAKIFGGGHVIPAATSVDIGDRNVEFARAFLQELGIPIVSERVGGEAPLDVRFHPHTGQAFVRTLQNVPSSAIVQEEIQFLRNAGAAGIA